MPRLAPTFVLVPALVLASITGCGDPAPQCVIDTDCDLGQRCASDRTCQLIGGGADASTMRDGGGARDGAVGDGGASDSGASDAAAPDSGVAEDAAIAPDAPSDPVDGGA